MKPTLIIFVSFLFPSLVIAGSWVTCADEGQACRFSGAKQVKYGANGWFIQKTFTNGISCTNQNFGRDPSYGHAKACRYYQPSWDFCAKEGKNCSVKGKKKIRYGAGKKWVEKTVSGSVSCSNSTFSDPSTGVTKACFVYR